VCKEAAALSAEVVPPMDWHSFIASTYGCCSDAPLSRGEQGHPESREIMR
jgi:hypothetical protein